MRAVHEPIETNKKRDSRHARVYVRIYVSTKLQNQERGQRCVCI